MKIRLDDQKPKLITPAPGTYEIHLKNKKSDPKFGFGTSKRSGEKTGDSPGPGNYKLKSYVGNTAPYAIPNKKEV